MKLQRYAIGQTISSNIEKGAAAIVSPERAAKQAMMPFESLLEGLEAGKEIAGQIQKDRDTQYFLDAKKQSAEFINGFAVQASQEDWDADEYASQWQEQWDEFSGELLNNAPSRAAQQQTQNLMLGESKTGSTMVANELIGKIKLDREIAHHQAQDLHLSSLDWKGHETETQRALENDEISRAEADRQNKERITTRSEWFDMRFDKALQDEDYKTANSTLTEHLKAIGENPEGPARTEYEERMKAEKLFRKWEGTPDNEKTAWVSDNVTNPEAGVNPSTQQLFHDRRSFADQQLRRQKAEEKAAVKTEVDTLYDKMVVKANRGTLETNPDMAFEGFRQLAKAAGADEGMIADLEARWTNKLSDYYQAIRDMQFVANTDKITNPEYGDTLASYADILIEERFAGQEDVSQQDIDFYRAQTYISKGMPGDDWAAEMDKAQTSDTHLLQALYYRRLLQSPTPDEASGKGIDSVQYENVKGDSMDAIVGFEAFNYSMGQLQNPTEDMKKLAIDFIASRKDEAKWDRNSTLLAGQGGYKDKGFIKHMTNWSGGEAYFENDQIPDELGPAKARWDEAYNLAFRMYGDEEAATAIANRRFSMNNGWNNMKNDDYNQYQSQGYSGEMRDLKAAFNEASVPPASQQEVTFALNTGNATYKSAEEVLEDGGYWKPWIRPHNMPREPGVRYFWLTAPDGTNVVTDDGTGMGGPVIHRVRDSKFKPWQEANEQMQVYENKLLNEVGRVLNLGDLQHADPDRTQRDLRYELHKEKADEVLGVIAEHSDNPEKLYEIYPGKEDKVEAIISLIEMIRQKQAVINAGYY